MGAAVGGRRGGARLNRFAGVASFSYAPMEPSPAPLDPRVLEAHVAGARRLALALLGDPESADDVVQDALVVALTRPPRLGWNLWAWFSGVVRNKAREQRRLLLRRAAPLGDHDPVGASFQPDLSERMETQRRLFDAVLALPEPYRQVVWLRHFEDLPPRTIAVRLTVPVETVRTRHRRALGRLREALGGTAGHEARNWRLALLPLAAPGGAGVVGSLGSGGVVMALGTKSIMALGVAAVLAGGLLFTTQPGEQRRPDPPPARPTARFSTQAPSLEGLVARSKPPPSSAEPATVTITGRVCDRDSNGIAAAQLVLIDTRRARAGWVPVADVVERASTDEAGQFAIRARASGELQLVARAAGFVKGGSVIAPHDGSGALDVGDVRLDRAATIQGRVLVHGEPIGGVPIFCAARPDDFSWRLDGVDANTDFELVEVPTLDVPVGCVGESAPDGSFEMRGLRAGAIYELRGGFGSAAASAEGVTAPARDIVLRIDGGVVLRAVVTGPECPASWRVVVHYGAPMRADGVLPDTQVMAYVVEGSRGRTLWFPPGRFEVHLMSGDGAAQMSIAEQVLASGASRTFEWPYTELRDRSRAEVVVRWGDGFRAAVVYLVGDAAGDVRARDLEGSSADRTTFDDVTAGPYDVVAAGGAGGAVTWGTARVEAVAGAAPARAHLRPCRNATLHFNPSQGSWVVEIRRDRRAWPCLVEAAGAHSEYVMAGRFVARSATTVHLVPGEYSVTIRATESGRTATRVVDAKPDEAIQVEGP